MTDVELRGRKVQHMNTGHITRSTSQMIDHSEIRGFAVVLGGLCTLDKRMRICCLQEIWRHTAGKLCSSKHPPQWPIGTRLTSDARQRNTASSCTCRTRRTRRTAAITGPPSALTPPTLRRSDHRPCQTHVQQHGRGPARTRRLKLLTELSGRRLAQDRRGDRDRHGERAAARRKREHIHA